MSKSTHPIVYTYLVKSHLVTVTRRHTGTAYPVNGNVHNPTEYFTWEVRIDGEYLTAQGTRAVAYEYARARIDGVRYRTSNHNGRGGLNERPWTLVQAEMRDNYLSKTDVKEA